MAAGSAYQSLKGSASASDTSLLHSSNDSINNGSSLQETIIDDDDRSEVSSIFESIHDQAETLRNDSSTSVRDTGKSNRSTDNSYVNRSDSRYPSSHRDYHVSYEDDDLVVDDDHEIKRGNFDDEEDYENDHFLYDSTNGSKGEKRAPLAFEKTLAKRRKLWTVVIATVVSLFLGSFLVYIFTHGPRAASESHKSGSIDQVSETASEATPITSLSDGPGLSQPKIDASKNLFLMSDWRSGKLRPHYEKLEWVPPAPGESSVHLLEESDKGFFLVNWPDRENKVAILESSGRAFTYESHLFLVARLDLSPTRKHALLAANIKKNYRHSTFANYFIYDVEKKTTKPLVPGNGRDFVALVAWSPLGDKVAYILDNNIYIRTLSGDDSKEDEIRQVTKDGGTEIFYGRPDWVYEEEVFGTDTAMWWSPTGDYLAYLRTNDSAVEEFPIPYFVQKAPASHHPYPELRNIKYPKPGTPNPIVDLLLLETKSFESYHVPIEANEAQDTEKLITEVVWTGDHNVIARMSDRDSSVLKVGVIDAKARTGDTSRVVNASVDGGWFEISQNTKFVPADPENGREEDGYIDMNVIDGYNHLVYYSPITATEPKAVITRGKWEVDDAQVAFNPRTNKVYFISTKKSSVERHVYSVNLDGSDLEALTDDSKDGYYSASFSPDSRYVLVDYDGPDVPWQVVLDLESDDIWGSAVDISTNEDLKKTVSKYELPETIYSQIKVAVDEDGNDILANAVEYRPPGFNASLQYPVLFYVYGGPVSQLVKKQFSYSFQQVVASSINAIVVTVDGRGTGFRGRAYRNVVRGHLGELESHDQIAAAKEWISRGYVDPERVAIWGWSYGGFMTLKTLETDAGNTFKYGMSVAPVTDWRYYDSIYTERYMRLPDRSHNEHGYDVSAIQNVHNISENVRFLVMHGTGDDNVHFQHTLTLLDKLDLEGVENYDVHVFPDSDHSIYYHGANTIVYDKLLHWISDAFSGKFLHFLKKRSEVP